MNSDNSEKLNSSDEQFLTDGICYIVAAGDPQELDFVPSEKDYVIAADAGINYLKAAGIRIDLALGDFDSLGEVPSGKNCGQVIKLNVIKDDTDTQAAIGIGLEKGYKTFHIYCAAGGKRIDHTISNLQSLIYLADRGAHGVMFDKDNAITVIRNEKVCFESMNGEYMSVFAVGGKAFGVTISGFMYEVTDYELDPGFPLGVSNQFTGKAGSVSVRDGRLLLVYPKVQHIF